MQTVDSVLLFSNRMEYSQTTPAFVVCPFYIAPGLVIMMFVNVLSITGGM